MNIAKFLKIIIYFIFLIWVLANQLTEFMILISTSHVSSLLMSFQILTPFSQLALNQPFLDVWLKKFGKNTKIKKMKLELPSRPVFSLEFKTWTLVLVCTLVHTVLTGNSTSFLMQLLKSTMDMLQMLITYQKWLLKVL